MQNANHADRGQTAIDFVVAMGVFFIAIAFVFAFVPAMFAPFFGMGAGDALVADRSAAYLAENALVEDPKQPGALDETAVDELLAGTCDGQALADALGVDTERVNVTIGEYGCGPAPDGSETVSERVVTFNDSQEILRVIVW